jgi:hypothetical protein
VSRKKVRATFTRLLLAAPALSLGACRVEEPPFYRTETLYPRALPDGGVFPPHFMGCRGWVLQMR